ncbi:MAG: hypothetical protein HGA55_07990, partial [Methanoregulaceae archaeon]|nr:hypothetical protein [Methanoregulaceae archaeon]
HTLAVFNRTVSKVDQFLTGRAQGKSVIGTHGLQELVASLIKPRRIMMMVKAGENGFNRAVLNISGLHILRQVHRTQKNSFDHITARMAASRNVAIDIDLYPLVHDSGPSRQKVLQRYQDIMTLWSRYRFPLTLSSNACSWLDLRSPDDMYHLCGLFGMNEGEVQEALETAENLLNPSRPAREVP